MSRKAQITMFFILGIVLIASVAFLVYVKTLLLESSLKREAKRVVKNFLENQNIEYYIDSCLDSITQEGLMLATLQGGHIWDFQGGESVFNSSRMGVEWLPFNESEFYNVSVNVSYGILNDSPSICYNTDIGASCIHALPEAWPFPDLQVKDFDKEYMTTCVPGVAPITPGDDCTGINPEFQAFRELELKPISGALGVQVLHRLCDLFGPNKYFPGSLNIVSRCNSWFAEDHNTQWLAYPQKITWNSMYGVNSSLQRDLKAYIEKKLPLCVNLSQLAMLYSYNITNVSAPNVSVILGPDRVVPVATYNFNVRLRSGSIVSTLYTFKKPLKNRLKTVYSFLSALLTLDVKRPEHNLLNTYLSKPIGLNISLLQSNCNVSSNCYFDKVLRIVDPSSKIFGKPMVLLVGIKNRRPVLDYIGNKVIPNVDLTVLEGTELVISPQGYDPDEGFLWYNYSWWQEDWYEELNKSCCHTGLVDCSNLSQIRQCMIINYSIHPHNFTNSNLFRMTGKNASYKLTSKDAGLHFLKVSVRDVSGLTDWQNISIFVVDLPIPILNTSNIYLEADKNFASIEDPYLLNASESVDPALGGIHNYTFIDHTEGWSKVVVEPEDYLWLPFNWRFLITYSLKASLINESVVNEHFNMLGQHEIELKVQTITGLEQSSNWTVNVTVCIPYRSNVWPYPYDKLFQQYTGQTVTNPFFSNHSCCVGNLSNGSTWSLKPASEPCLNLTFYGFMLSDNYPGIGLAGDRTNLKTNFLQIQVPGHPASFTSNGLPNLVINQSNDVWALQFTRYCTGDRGNICAGNGEFYYYQIADCYYNESLTEQCQGPSPELINAFPSINISKATCVGYNDTTFENLLVQAGFLTSATGRCLEGEHCVGDLLMSDFKCQNGDCIGTTLIKDCSLLSECRIIHSSKSYHHCFCNETKGNCSCIDEDPDNAPEYCAGCGQTWFEDYGCCGDDIDEYVIECSCNNNCPQGLCALTGPAESDQACCNETSDCVSHYTCYDEGTILNGCQCQNSVWVC